MATHSDSSVVATLLFVGVAALACRQPDYLPLAPGQQWRFAATEYEIVPPDTLPIGTRTYALAVTGSATQPGLGKVYEVLLRRDDESRLSLFFRKTRDDVFVLPASHLDGLEPTSSWLRLLALPLREGAFWYGDEERSVSFDVMARERSTAVIRSRDCFRIRIHASAPYRMDVWLAPDAGIVRWVRHLSPSRFEVADRVRR